MWKDFKAFAFKGNVLELAIAVVIGAAFGKIVSSLVENIITPLIGLVMGGVDLLALKVLASFNLWNVRITPNTGCADNGFRKPGKLTVADS